jgi:hypothetical protein
MEYYKRVKGKSNNLNTINRRKVNLIGHITEGKIEGRI